MSADRSIAVAVMMLSVVGAVPSAAAQMIAKPQPEANAAPDTKAADAAKALATGTKAFENGRTDAAVAALTTAIMSGSLKNPELAKAYFYRGVAQRTQKKPGAALSDLNAAVWLRDGLSATDKAVAEDHRQALLREVAGGAGAPPAVAAAPVETAAPVAAAPAPAANPPPVPAASAAGEAPAQSASLFSWLTPDPAPPAVQAPVEPALQPPPAPIAQTVAPAEQVSPPPIEDKPLPWTTAESEAKTVPEPPAIVAAAPEPAAPADTVGEPVASVASVERGTIAPLHAEPAPPEKPLPWQTAAAAEPANSQPLPWAAGNAVAPAPAPTAAPPAPPAPVAAAPATVAASEPPPPLPPAASSTPLSDNVSATAETVNNAASAASTTLATAGQAATQFIGSLFGGGGGDAGSPPQEQPAQEQAAVAQASSAIEAPAAAPVPVNWTAETKTVPAPARIETASISKPVKEAAGKAEPAWNAATRTAAPEAVQPTVIAAAQPVPEPAARDTKALPQPPVRIATTAEPTPPADVAQPAVMPGPYRLQIAAENSREEAEQTLARLLSKHKTSLKGLEPVIEEPQTGNVLFGSMGAAYRVSIGPYQTAVEPGRLCNILQPRGFDCRVVAVTP
jgi:hypothetical protein